MKNVLIGVTCFLLLACCEEQHQVPTVVTPTTYVFERNGQSTVNFSGQTTRLAMLDAIKAEMKKGDAGDLVDSNKLLGMYANEGNQFENAELNTSGKQLEDKTYLTDITFFKDLFIAAGIASADYVQNGTEASAGVAGLMSRGTSTILVNEKGWEYSQMVEKGMMGAVLLNQIYNIYLTDDFVGSATDNTNLEIGKNYTPKEHHWDEAFGYWGVSTDLPLTGNLFLGLYTYGEESVLGPSVAIKDAYLKGRVAIVADDQATIDDSRITLYNEFELYMAAIAIHYLNEALGDANLADQGNLFHHLSEGYGFISALKYSPYNRLSAEDLDLILNTHLGDQGNFWEVTSSDLINARTILVNTFPELESVANRL